MLIISILAYITKTIPLFGHILNLILVPIDALIVAAALVQDVAGSDVVFKTNENSESNKESKKIPTN